jgi:tetratricopeptide (TPR) repeat protein
MVVADRARRARRAARCTTACVAGALLLGLALGMGAAPATAGAQQRMLPDSLDPLMRALDAEEKGRLREASVAYREVLQAATAGHREAGGVVDGDRIALALLGLERSWAELGVRDSLLPVVEAVLLRRRTDPVARSIQLRTLFGMGDDEGARRAFIDWRRVAGSDAGPWREYARLLMSAGRALAADSVLTEATRLLGRGGMLANEVAQLHVALGRWVPAAAAFRETVDDDPWLETAALFALQRAPAETRDSMRAVLRADPVTLPARRLLSSLELSWGEPRRAWLSLSAVRADDSTAAAWREFGERAEIAGAWGVARDVWAAVLERRPGDLEAQQRGAQAALRAGDAEAALTLARAPGSGDADARRRALLPIEIAALGELGRPQEAQRRLDEAGRSLDDATRAELARPLVGAWLKLGDLERARAAAAKADLADDDETAGWLALYEGDLVTARRRLVRADTRRGTLVDALGLLARTRETTSPALGRAFLSLARRDSADAARRFTAIADSMSDAAPALLAFAARIEAARPGGTRAAAAVALWSRIVQQHPKSPEAPEALLAWGRALRDAGDSAGAIARLETLLVDYPDSALLPQARRDLERLRGRVPPDRT